ncbi:hypothetical protein HY745_01315 [Candidatus Desantisbacteria bacterium]|nr:hypothetical protein [Candidatus Desantisbacteria bacterium]
MREIFYKALQNHAISMICVHNHPSGSSAPSLEDKKFTKDLVAVSKTLEIKVLDHIIIGNNVFYSFADEGLI